MCSFLGRSEIPPSFQQGLHIFQMSIIPNWTQKAISLSMGGWNSYNMVQGAQENAQKSQNLLYRISLNSVVHLYCTIISLTARFILLCCLLDCTKMTGVEMKWLQPMLVQVYAFQLLPNWIALYFRSPCLIEWWKSTLWNWNLIILMVLWYVLRKWQFFAANMVKIYHIFAS